jgi:hypothetical protein
MQMMMQMMQMMMGGMGMMGGMPGMMGGMPGGFTPMLGDNVGNFLGMPGSVPNGGDPGNGGFPVAPPAQETQDAPAHAQQAPAAPAQQAPAAPAQQAPAAPAQQTPAAPAPPKEQGKTGQTKTGAPPGFKAMKGKVPPEVVAKAKSLLNQPMGTEIPFEINGKNYMARLETHYHPQGYVGGPNGYHKGVTVYEQA